MVKMDKSEFFFEKKSPTKTLHVNVRYFGTDVQFVTAASFSSSCDSCLGYEHVTQLNLASIQKIYM